MTKKTDKAAEADALEPVEAEQAPAEDAAEPTVELRGEHGPEILKPFGRPKPRYCARPNCGLRPEPGSTTCAHHRGWTP